jgi:integrase
MKGEVMIRKKGKRYEVRAYDPALKRNVYVGMRPQKKPGNGVVPDPAVHATALEKSKEDEFRRAFEGGGEEAWLDARSSKHAEKPWRRTTREHNEERTDSLAEEFENRNPDEIPRWEGQAWAQRNPARSNQARAMVNWMRDKGLCDTNPFERSGIGKGPGRKDDVPLTLDDLDNLKASCDVLGARYADQFRGFIVWQSFVGCRPGEGLHTERKKHINVEDGTVWIEGQKYRDGTTGVTKNGKDRLVILPDPALEVLELIAPRVDSPWLFHNKRSNPLLYATMLTYWHKVCDASGLSRDARWLTDGEPNGIDPYHLRHFCGSYLADLGADAADIAIQLGHTDGGKLAQELYIHTYEERALARLHEHVRKGRNARVIPHPRFINQASK